MRRVEVDEILVDEYGEEWRVRSCDDFHVTIERVTGVWIEPDLTYEELERWLGKALEP